MKENPADYVLNPFQQATLDLWTTRDNIGVNYQRANYGTEVGLYHPENGGSYVPHINTNMDLVRQGLTTAAREGARVAALPGSTDADIQERVTDFLAPLGVTTHNVQITHATLADPSETVRLTVPYADVTLLGSFFGRTDYDLGATCSMRKEGVE